MVHSFTFPQEMIDSIQERIESIERCQNDANTQDEEMGKLLDLVNSRQISFSQIKDKWIHFGQKFNKLNKLGEKLNIKIRANEYELPVLIFVRYNFLLKEILDSYWDFFHNENGEEHLVKMLVDFVELWNNKGETDSATYQHQKGEFYIMVETLKHVIQSLITASLRVNALTEEDINAFDLGDITPQESEAMLISLASTKKWDQVYRNLA